MRYGSEGQEREREMKTNEEIMSKIREMKDAENNIIKFLFNLLKQQEERKEIEKADKTRNELNRRLESWVTLVDLEEFAEED